MPERGIPYSPPAIAVVPMRIWLLKDHLVLGLGQVLAQTLVL